ncbi:hypothetical protein ATANTOWER_023621 [Ataeniobius toweri]|uniref:Uncharacterized protein n=1 Tax=Ataeniobius toweri TaxID=208326 RepID=A0ABU7CD16_9TELE|nr:hypothetical protein [Ataeniobius toweri]
MPVSGVSALRCVGGSRCPGLDARVCVGSLSVASWPGLGTLALFGLYLGWWALGSRGPCLDLLRGSRLPAGPVGSQLQLSSALLWGWGAVILAVVLPGLSDSDGHLDVCDFNLLCIRLRSCGAGLWLLTHAIE